MIVTERANGGRELCLKTKCMRFLTLVFIGFIHWSCGQGQPTVKNLGDAEFKTALTTKTVRQLIDVRTNAEVKTGVIANARQCDLSSPRSGQQFDQLDQNVPVYVYCAVGGRSAQAAQLLVNNGFKQFYNLSGGIQSWMRTGNTLQPIHP